MTIDSDVKAIKILNVSNSFKKEVDLNYIFALALTLLMLIVTNVHFVEDCEQSSLV